MAVSFDRGRCRDSLRTAVQERICAWSGHDPQLHQEAERVRPIPMLDLLAVLHPEELDSVGGGLLPGRANAEELTLVGAGLGRPDGYRLPLGDHVMDLGAQVGEGRGDHVEELLGLLGALAAEGVVNPIGDQQLIEGVDAAKRSRAVRATNLEAIAAVMIMRKAVTSRSAHAAPGALT
jgi:hypothetical protein